MSHLGATLGAMPDLSQRELRNDSGGVLRRVEAGETFTVTRRGVPVADLVPHRGRRSGATRYVPAEHIARDLTDVPAWGAETFEKEQGELDARVDDEWRDPWPSR